MDLDITLFFYKNSFIKHEAHFCQKFKNKLRTIQPQQKSKISNFQLSIVNKTAASAAQLAKCICFTLIPVQLLASSCASINKNYIANLTSWHNSIFDYK